MEEEEPQGTWKSPYLGSGPGLTKVKDIWIPKIFLSIEADKFEKIEAFQARSEDLWLSSYPKSGTSWLQMIVYMLVRGKDIITQNQTSDETFPYIEGIMPVTERLNAMENPRLIKTHLPFSMLPPTVASNKSKIIYIARNVKDVSVSAYHFNQLVVNIDYKGTFSNFLDEFLQGKVFYSKWWDHVIGYWQERQANNVLFIKYEDLHKDTSEQILKIARFLQIETNDEQIRNIIQQSTFKSMQENPQVNYSWNEERGLFKKNHTNKFFRRGIVGDWQNHYTEEMSSKVDEINEETIKPKGLEFDYKL